MLLIILALFWVALLAPVVVRRLRDSGTERSIDSFHAEHEVLSRQEYVVPPVHRLARSDQEESGARGAANRPHLTVVHANDTYRSLETRGSWDDWSEDYDYERASEPSRRTQPSNRYAAAYSSVPRAQEVRAQRVAPVRRRSMKARRRVVFTRLVLAAVVTTALSFAVGYSILVDLAILAWIALVGFVALTLYAVALGYLNESSLPVHLPRGRQIATIRPLYDEVPEEFDSEFYDSEAIGEWRRESPPRRAVG